MLDNGSTFYGIYMYNTHPHTIIFVWAEIVKIIPHKYARAEDRPSLYTMKWITFGVVPPF